MKNTSIIPKLVFLLLIGLPMVVYPAPRKVLSADLLLQGQTIAAPVAMKAYARPEHALSSEHTLRGRLVARTHASSYRVLRDHFKNHDTDTTGRDAMPAFELELVQTGDYLVPAFRGPIPGEHESWNLIVLPGRVWKEAGDRGYSRASLPFSLQQKNENCTHNGVMSFLFRGDGAASYLAYQVSSETCYYYQADMWGLMKLDYFPGPVSSENAVVKRFKHELTSRMPTRPIKQLEVDYPGEKPVQFFSDGTLDPEHVTLYGFVIDGVNYQGNCDTRHGPYPFCDMLVLPSYSLAKSLYVGLGLMRLESKWPGTVREKVAGLVKACARNGNWEDVTLAHLANMTTGNFLSPDHQIDETSSHFSDFNAAKLHKEKIELACDYFPRKALPGSRWVYHSSDSYIASSAFDNYMFRKSGEPSDFFTDILLEDIWRPLGLSPTSEYPLRTQDSPGRVQGYNGFSFLPNDIAKLSNFLNADQGRINTQSIFDETLFEAALHRSNREMGVDTSITPYRYSSGFWGLSTGICEKEIRYAFMSGYGGINVALFPNRSSYYVFSDNKQFDLQAPAMASHQIRSFCDPYFTPRLSVSN
jgi:CubicO group peptidase (beta-lactamase class C family)